MSAVARVGSNRDMALRHGDVRVTYSLTMKDLAVAVTGVGAIGPHGTGMDALRRGEGASRECRLPSAEPESAGHGIAEELAAHGSRATLLAIAASRMALARRGDRPLPETAGIVLGTSLMDLGALAEHRRAFDTQGSEALPPSILHFSLPLSHAGFAAVTLGLPGPVETKSWTNIWEPSEMSCGAR